ncbi:hypothetical protein GCM10022224_058510 [Nonomuraea antimicrobica]|uniref:Major facilitator superfamily (MFS) profile domain-containing protein n=1 Tax=Nonomuraea antimicrobica TaxID=561173 RepID=A0ABP7CB31_9ACTN
MSASHAATGRVAEGGVTAAPGGALSRGLRIGLLFGPTVFGVTAAGVALPQVSAALEAGSAAVAWVLIAHALALGVGTALFGRFADSWGVRTSLLAGSAVLAVGAIACVAAPNLGVLVAGRLLLATGSGAMAAGGLALLAMTAPELRARCLAVYGAVMAVFAAAAPLLGGLVTAWPSWRATVALPVLSLLAVPFCLPLVTRPGSGQRIDYAGAAALAGAAGALLVAIQSGTLGLPGPVAIGLAAVALLLGAWVLRRKDGFVPRPVVADRRFVLAMVIGVGIFGGLFATMYAVPQLLAREYGWSVLEVGAALLPGAVVGAVGSRMAGSLTARWGRTVLAGVAAAAGLTLGYAGLAGGGPWPVVVGAALGLAAFAVAQVVLTAEMSGRIPPPQRGAGMGLLNLTFFVGGGAGSAICGALAGPLGLTAALAVVAVFPLVAAVVAVASR